MTDLRPDIELVLRAGYVAIMGVSGLEDLRAAVAATEAVALSHTLGPVRNAAVKLLACEPAARAGWIETLRQQLLAHLNYQAVMDREASRPPARDWEAFRARYSRPADEAAVDSWRKRSDLQ